MSGEFLQSLIRDGKVAGWWPFNAGHVQDLSGNNNHGIINGNCYFESDGLRFADNTAYVEVPHHTSLDLTNVTMVLLKPEQRNYRLSSGVGNIGGIGKRDSGVGTIWFAYFSTNFLTLNDGTVARWTGASYDDDERYTALSLAAAGGGTAIGYREGVSIGNFNGANTLPTNTHNLRIGRMSAVNYYVGTIQSVMLLNVALTASEHALLYADLTDLEWPTCCYGHAERYQDVDKKESGLVAGWDMRPAGGVVADQVGSNDGTIYGGVLSSDGILGSFLDFDGVDDYIDASSLDSYPHGLGNLTLEAWVKTDTAQTAKVVMGWWWFQDNSLKIRNNKVRFTITADVRVFTEANIASIDGLWHHVVGTYDKDAGANNVKIYVDGVLQSGVVTTTGNIVSTSKFNIANINDNVTSAYKYQGEMICPEIYNVTKDQAWVTQKYLEGAQAIQFQTDWGMQVSPAQEGGILHQYIGSLDSPFQAGDTTGRWKIETDTVNGQLCKVLTCLTEGSVYVPTALLFDTSETEAAFGTWDAWLYRPTGQRIDWSFISPTGYVGNNPVGSYKLYLTDASTDVYETAVGAVINGTPMSPDAWHRYRITRTNVGLFSLYTDGTADGMGTDLTQLTSRYIVCHMQAGCKLSLSSVDGDECFYKMLGVNPA